MKSLSEYITEAMLGVNSEGGMVNGVEVLGRDVDIDIEGTIINVEPKSNNACVFLNGGKAKEIDLTLNLKDAAGVQIDGGNAKNINIKSTGVAVRRVDVLNVTKCDTVDLSELTVDGFVFMDTCKGVKTFIGPRGQFVGSISKNVNLQTLDLSAADSIGVEKATLSQLKIDKNRALKDLRLPEDSFGQHDITDFTADDIVKAGLKNVKGRIYCADKEVIFEPGTIDDKNFDTSGALKTPYRDYKYLKNGRLSTPTR